MITDKLKLKMDIRNNNDTEIIISKDILQIIQRLSLVGLIELRDRNFDFLLNDNFDIETSSYWGRISGKILNEYPDDSLKQNDIGNNIIIDFLNDCNRSQFDEIYNYLLGAYIDKLLSYCNDYFNAYFSQVHYIAPLRASAQRYYRLQGLAVDEIDPQGENIPMAINHLNNREKKQFKTWTMNNFGFEIDTKYKEGHVTLNISFNEKESLNLADTGFGFSQVLPIILLLWRIENNHINVRTNRIFNLNNTHTIVIEQPELHLHPGLQAN